MSVDISKLDAALKIQYAPGAIANLVYKNRPTLALIKKRSGVGGKKVQYDVAYEEGVGSATFANAQTANDGSKFADFLLGKVNNYQIVEFTRGALLDTKGGGANAFFDAKTFEIDAKINACSNDAATQLFRDSGGNRGQVGSIASAVLTLKNPRDVVNFSVGMSVVGSAAKAGTSPHTAVAITAIDRTAGTLTAAAWTGYSANDYLFRAGDIGGTATGLDDWLPTTTAAVGTLGGFDRSVDPTRLGGVRYTASGEPIDQAMRELLTLMAIEGAAPDYFVLNPSDFNDLVTVMDNKVQYVDVSPADTPSVGFKAVQFACPTGMTRVMTDNKCPQGRGYALTLDTWEIFTSQSALVEIIQDDGMMLKRRDTADSFEVRVSAYWNLACRAPVKNGVVVF